MTNITADMVEIVTEPCMVCKAHTVLMVNAAAFIAWKSGAMIQVAFPELSDEQRELIQTGTHSDCWDLVMPEEDDDEDLV